MEFLFAAFVFAAGWYIRYRYDRPGVATDLNPIILLWIGTPRQYSQLSPLSWHWRSHFLFNGYYCFRCFCMVGLILNIYLLPQVYKKRQENKIEIQELEAKVKRLQCDFENGRYTSQYNYNDEWSPLKPILFPCRTSHTRIFPQKHSFSYSYLFIGIPVGWRGWVSSLLTADLKTLPWRGRKPRNGWFNIDSADFLARGDSMHGLRGKLDTYLESQVSVSCMSLIHTLMVVNRMRKLRTTPMLILSLRLDFSDTPSTLYHFGIYITGEGN